MQQLGLEIRERLLRELQNDMSRELKTKSRLSRKEKNDSVDFLLEKWREILLDSVNETVLAPQNSGLTILREEIDGGTEFTLVRPNGKFFVLNKLLPKGFRCVPGDVFACVPLWGIVLYNMRWLDGQGFVCGLLHEFGHARHFGTRDIIRASLYAAVPEQLCSGKFIDRRMHFLLKGEHLANEYALEQLRRLEGMGFPVLPAGGIRAAQELFALTFWSNRYQDLALRASSWFERDRLFEDLFINGHLKLSLVPE